MTAETGKVQEVEPKPNNFSIELSGWSPENIRELNLTDLARQVQLAGDVRSILSSFPTASPSESTSTKLIFPFGQQPNIIHNTCVAYKYHSYGGMNSIQIQEGHEFRSCHSERSEESLANARLKQVQRSFVVSLLRMTGSAKLVKEKK